MTVPERGAYVGMGNTAEHANGVVLGRRGRGAKGDGPFNRRTGAGYVKAEAGDYARARASAVTVVVLLVETFGLCINNFGFEWGKRSA